MPGVYISYPFCAQKCTYCNFASGVFPRDWEPRYLAALQQEIRAHSWPWQPETVYLGGGTPSNLSHEALQALLEAIPGRPWQEATLEASPGGITTEMARAWAECGINRVSLGVQSFVEPEIRRTGRKHTAALVEQDLHSLAAAGITNYNLDLIAGLAGQTAASWTESLDWIERLAPPHVSVYMLEVDDESRLGREMLLGGVRYGAGDIPSDDAIAGFYETAVERLARMGVPRYEISNFARPGFESRHNLKYWKLEPYAGFGADAHSFDGRMRRQNPESLEEYLAAAPAPAPVEAQPEEEHFFVGLRLMQGIRPNDSEWQRFAGPIHRFLDAGLLETEAGVLRLTNQGVLLSNEVFQEFLAQ
ncbi:MAG TPA: radical SAM family heme chaperone HemW [Candidatus Sulfopaludibacter sp.]|nr:radical SAM family heme chaperone HemW [Candidatus Sulfopaludibacter sp.]